MKKKRHRKDNDRHRKDAPCTTKECAEGEPNTLTAIGGDDPSSLPLEVMASPAAINVEDDAATGLAVPIHAAPTLDLSGREGTAKNESNTLPNPVGEASNGELLPIDDLHFLTAEEQEVVRQSDAAFARVRQSWECWKQVRAGLVILRNLAMREAGANDPKSKLYKDRFHQLLEQRAYCSAKLEPSVRKALLKCAELAPEIDEWHDTLDECRRLRLNHPVNVLHAFRQSEGTKPVGKSNRKEHERDLEKVRQEAAAAVSIRDEQISELKGQVDRLSNRDDVLEPAESDTYTVVQYVIAVCGGAEIKIRQVIDALNAYLESHAE